MNVFEKIGFRSYFIHYTITNEHIILPVTKKKKRITTEKTISKVEKHQEAIEKGFRISGTKWNKSLLYDANS